MASKPCTNKVCLETQELPMVFSSRACLFHLCKYSDFNRTEPWAWLPCWTALNQFKPGLINTCSCHPSAHHDSYFESNLEAHFDSNTENPRSGPQATGLQGLVSLNNCMFKSIEWFPLRMFGHVSCSSGRQISMEVKRGWDWQQWRRAAICTALAAVEKTMGC